MLIAITMVRDEADILPWTLEHMLAQVDHVIIADNRSVDGCVEAAIAYAERNMPPPTTTSRVTVIEDPEPAYYQDDKMTGLAHQAWQMGATWVVPWDADEAWYHLDQLREDPPYDILTARPYVMVPQPGDDADDPNPITRMLWRTPGPEPLPKVVFRANPYARLHMGNHGVDGAGHRVHHHALGCRHYQFRSLDHLRRKIRNGMEAYNAAGAARASSGSYWRDLAGMAAAGTLDAWWDQYVTQPLIHDPDA